MGSKTGVFKIAAKKLGISFEDYTTFISQGLKHCWSCKSWIGKINFHIDKSRGDGLKANCQVCTRVKEKKCTKGRTSTFKGKTHTDEAKAAMSKKKKGKKLNYTRIISLKTRIKISQRLRITAVRGEACHSYKDGKIAERRGERFSIQYKRWRYDVFVRDHFACQECGDNKGGNLNAHHIKPFATHPELRYDVNNGITLCERCHANKHY